ncbi:unnamed protein product [Camellia sinensis]
MHILMDNFKHRKMYEVQDISVDEDQISNLPDCILHHILSFLPTKDVVATCLLSTRWKYLWSSVPILDFDDSLLYSSEVNDLYPPEMTCFMNFVERVLLFHDGSSMKKFRLSCRVCFNASRIHAWVSAAIKQKVQELDLCLFVEEPFILPCCVFYCESLTAVKIEMNCVLELPTCVSFPRLKTLYLALVTFLDDDSTQRLLSSCPVLQELTILDCDWMNLKRISVSIPTLKSLTIDDLPYFGSADELNGCQIKIDAANLIFLTYSGYLLNEIFLFNLSSLVNASIYVPIMCERQKEIAYRAVNLLRGLNSVKSMRISTGAIEDNVLDHLPIFQKLTYLELSVEIEKHIVKKLMNLLQYSPNLESLVFAEGFNPHAKEQKEVIDQLQMLPRVSTSLVDSFSWFSFGNWVQSSIIVAVLFGNTVLCSCDDDAGFLRNDEAQYQGVDALFGQSFSSQSSFPLDIIIWWH